jgi:hypothetical protein
MLGIQGAPPPAHAQQCEAREHPQGEQAGRNPLDFFSMSSGHAIVAPWPAAH